MLQWKAESVQQTLYDILSIKEDVSHEEIRTSYRSAILSYHPDKVRQNGSDDDPRSSGGSEKTFLKIQKAWEVLGNPRSRAIYDSELRASRQDTGGGASEDVGLEDMMAMMMMMEDDDGQQQVLELFYQCRCGDYFSVDSSELEKMGFKLLRKGEENEVCFETTTTTTEDALPASSSVVLPCGSCSLQVRLLIDPEIKGRWVLRKEARTRTSLTDLRSFSSTPEVLITEIEAAISKLEYGEMAAHASELLESPSPTPLKIKGSDAGTARMADEAYRAECAALAVGKLDEALQSTNRFSFEMLSYKDLRILLSFRFSFPLHLSDSTNCRVELQSMCFDSYCTYWNQQAGSKWPLQVQLVLMKM